MTQEARLDRLERFAKLFIRAGVRYRRDFRELGDRLNIMVNAKIRNEQRFKGNEAIFPSRSADYEKRSKRSEERLSKLAEKTDQKFVELAESQARTDRNLAELIKIVRSGRHGNPPTDS